MSLIPMTVFLDDSSRATETILVPSETIFKIIPAVPNKKLPDGTIGFDQANRCYGQPGWTGQNDPGQEQIGKSLRKGAVAETFLEFYFRTANPRTKSVLILRHPSSNGYQDTYMQMPHTVAQIAARECSLGMYKEAQRGGMLRRFRALVPKIV